MTSKVAIVKFKKMDKNYFNEALSLIDGIDDLNTAKRAVAIKVGVFNPKAGNHTSVDVLKGIVSSFDRAPKIYVAESDNYKGNGLERLKIWKELFNDRVIPISLSDDADAMKVKVADREMNLSRVLFKPNVLVSTHILRSAEKGSVLKNLFGCIPDPKKVKFHKEEIFYGLLADIYEAVGGIDFAVLDGTYLWRGYGNMRDRLRANTLLMSRDAVALEAVGATLAGMNPERMQVIQEFAKRGLGEARIDKIEIVGIPLETLKETFATPSATSKRARSKRSS